jgi:ferrous iron transport protein B
LVIGALFPPSQVFGWIPTQALLLVAMYFFSTATTLVAASVLGRSLIRGVHIPLILELPRYRFPSPWSTLRSVWLRARDFLVEAGTVILGFTVLLWFLLSYPKPDELQLQPPPVASEVGAAFTPENKHPIEYSFAGRLGKALAPVTAPLGFDWKLTVGILGAFSAREVFVSTLGLVYGIDDQGGDAEPLREHMRAEKRPDGKPAYPPLVGLSLMVFFALACQCMSTLAVVKRETKSWRWPLLLFSYMTLLAYAASFIVYQVGKLLGFAA